METPIETPEGDQPVWPPGWQVSVVDETGSTNADLLRAAAADAADRTVLAALHQTAGRGRLERRWEAPAGANLLVSILFREVPTLPHTLTQRVALAALDACDRVAGVRPTLKWPNDLLLNGLKMAGILAQADLRERGEQSVVVVGIGLNVGWAPEGATKLGRGIDPLRVLQQLLIAYDELPANPWSLYRESLGTIGQRVNVELADSTVAGRAVDVEHDGRLLVVDDEGVRHRFEVGDVVHLR